MRFIDHFLKRRKPTNEEIPKSEILRSVLIPAGHQDRFILRNQAESFFAPYIEYIGQSLAEVYGVNNIVRRQRNKGDEYHSTFADTPFLYVEYRVLPIEVLDNSPSIFYGEMMIKQPHVDLGLAGKLHKTLLDAHPGQGFTLSYTFGDDPGFQIFHSKGDEIFSQGEGLLQKMGVQTPTEAIAYRESKNTRLWQRIPIELRQ